MDNSAEVLNVIKSLTSAMQGMLQAIQHLHNSIEIVEQRVQVLEEHDYNKPELEKLLIDLGFRNDR